MATHHDDEGGSRLWRGMRALLFGGDGEPSLRDQIEEAIEEAEDARPVAGDLTPSERTMMRNLLHFGDRTAGDICVTRGDIIAVPSTISFEALVRAFVDAGHSRLPVFGDSLDEVMGMVHIKDVFMASVDPERDRSLTALMRVPLFVPEFMGVIELLARMRAERTHLAIVVDEFGGTEGLVTIEDVVEEIVGDIEDEHDEAEAGMLTMLEDGLWEADARIELEELAKTVDRRLTWEEDEVDTLGGLVFLLAGHIPAPGECVIHPSGWRLEAVDFGPAPDPARATPLARWRAPAGLALREQLGGVGHGLELERVPGGVAKEHCRLLAGLAFEAHRRRNHELGTRALQPLGQRAPLVHRQDDSKMRHRHIIAVDRIGCPPPDRIGREVSDDLMAIEVEINPMIRAPALAAAEQAAVKATRRSQVVDRESEMEGRQCHRASVSLRA